MIVHPQFPVPKDIFYTVLKQLTCEDWGKMQRVCTVFRCLITSPEFEYHWKRRLPSMYYTKYIHIPFPINWRMTYIKEALRDRTIQKMQAEYTAYPENYEKLVSLARLIVEREEYYESWGDPNEPYHTSFWLDDRVKLIKPLSQMLTKNDKPELTALLGKIFFYTRPNLTFHYLEKAYEQKCVDVITYFGRCYLRGGFPGDVDNAFRLFEEGDKLGLIESTGSLGFAYKLGRGCDVNLDLAFQKIKCAADHGLQLAELEIARLYLNGGGCELDAQQAFIYCKRAADKGLTEALCLLAGLNVRGVGTIKNEELALHYLRAAAIQQPCSSRGEHESILDKIVERCQQVVCGHNIEAHYLMAYFYLNGIGITKDVKLGMDCLRYASSRNHILAHEAQVKCYIKGIGCETDMSEVSYHRMNITKYHLNKGSPYSIFEA